jgi:hypothetical protein
MFDAFMSVFSSFLNLYCLMGIRISLVLVLTGHPHFLCYTACGAHRRPFLKTETRDTE